MSQKNWKVDLNEARELRKKGAELLHQRVSLLVAIYDDQDFKDYCESEGLNDLDYLDSELEDTAATFLTLKAVLEVYPNASDWSKHNIRDLIADAIAKGKENRAVIERKSWKAIAEELKADNERLRNELRIKDELLEKTMAVGRKK